MLIYSKPVSTRIKCTALPSCKASIASILDKAFLTAILDLDAVSLVKLEAHPRGLKIASGYSATSIWIATIALAPNCRVIFFLKCLVQINP